MKITKIKIENFRSIKELSLTSNSGINSIVGANSTGKTNFFEAINWILGHTYPSFNSVRKQDYFKGDTTNKIKIRLTFDDKEYLELAEEWTDPYGHIKSGLNHSGKYCTDETRRKYCIAHVGVDREITEYLPANRWSLLGRLLQQINDMFIEEKIDGSTTLKSDKLKEDLDKIRDELLFSVKDQDGNKIMDKFVTILREEFTKQMNCSNCEVSLNFNLYNPWNFYKTLQLIVREEELNQDFQASELGMGFQASITIAILKAYASLKLKNQPPIFIDEPELFLHPQAQRNFYKILRELSDQGAQIFYTTHSPNFLSVANFDEVFITRKNGNGTYVNYVDASKFVIDHLRRTGNAVDSSSLKLQYQNAYENTGDSRESSEAFFAKKIILVEGQSERLLLPYYFKKIGYDFVHDGVTIVCCGNKSEIPRFFRLYSEFGIPCYVLFDGDSQHAGTASEALTIRKNKEFFSLLEPSNTTNFPDDTPKDNYLGFEKTLNDNLGFPSVKKGLSLFIEAKQKYDNEHVSIPNWTADITQKIKQLPLTAHSVLQS